MRIEEDIKLDYSDVLFRPKRSTLSSRKDVALRRTYKFKEGYKDYCNRVNRWIPKIRGLNKTFSENEFKLKKIIYKEYNTTFVWTVGATLLFAYNNYKIKGDIQPDLVYYYSTLIFLSITYLITRFLKKREQRNKTYKV